jgi:D-arabinitol dehydrogenase (NADP+)
MANPGDVAAWRPYELFRLELTLKGSFAQVNCVGRAVSYLKARKVRTEGIITHRFPLGSYGAALAAVRDDQSCVKAVVTP